ncbi:MAG: type II secretion system secretin GspD [Halieaceae bacterium]|nr:type II secretion system secretin GspD [Halieaceae bacterium]
MNFRRIILSFFLLVNLAVGGCSNLIQGESGNALFDRQAENKSTSLPTKELNLAQDAREQPIIYMGTDRQIKMPQVQNPLQFIGDDVSLNFENAPLAEVMHAVMSDILKLDYVVDGSVSGTVTLRTKAPISRSKLLFVLESLLNANGVMMIKDEDNRYLITSSAQGSKLYPSVGNPNNVDAGYSTVIVSLEYIGASDMEEILRPLAEEKTFVRVDNVRNLLMLAGTRAQLSGWLDIVKTFDVDRMEGMSVGLFPIRNSGVEETTEALNVLLGKSSGSSGLSSSSGSKEMVEDLAPMVRIIPFARLASILVVTPRAHYLETVRKWIERLDNPETSFGEKRLYVYPVQNTTSQRLAELLTKIYSPGSAGSSNRSGGQKNTNGGVAPGMKPESIGSGSGSGKGAAGAGAVSVVSSGTNYNSIIDDVRVVADEENNSLMIYSTGMQFRKIEAALEKLDVAATQILIEASILEVTLTDKLRYGLEWAFRSGGLGGSSYSGSGSLSSSGGPSGTYPGFNYTVANSSGGISGVLNMLSSESLVNVISSPSVMVLDNSTATIQVGDQVPILTGTAFTDGGNSIQSIEYRDTGVQLTVTPSVNAGGLVTMEVSQSVTDVGIEDAATGQRSFMNREIESKVSVRSGESVVLGGLIRDNVSKSGEGVPWLHKIPILGAAFGKGAKSGIRTELVVIITPRALYDDSQLREVSKDMRARVREMKLIKN